MQTEVLTIAENLLAEIYIMCAAQKDNKTIDHGLIFKVNELLTQMDPALIMELRYNNRELEATGFNRYRSDLVRVFNGYVQSFADLLPDHHVTTRELPPGGPDGFKINHNYTIADVQQFLHDVLSYIDSVIDKEFPGQGTEIDLPELNTINEKLLLLKYTGIYEQIKTICKDKKVRMSELISLITGQNPKAIKVVLNYLESQNSNNKNTPYTLPAMSKVLNTLTLLHINSGDLVDIIRTKSKDD